MDALERGFAPASPEVSYKHMLAASAGQYQMGAGVPSTASAGTVKKAHGSYSQLSKSALKALGSGDLGAAESALAGLSPKDRLRALADLRTHHSKEYGTLQNGIRSSQVKSDELTLATSLDSLKGTKWAQTKEGRAVVAHLESKYVKVPPTLKFGDAEGGVAKTIPDNKDAYAGQNGKRTGSTIVLNSTYASSPEGLAATLAHEGQHSLRYSQGKLKTDLQEETDAHMAQSAVWNEFDGKKLESSAVKGGHDQWSADAKYYDAKDNKRMMNHVAAEYAAGYRDLAKKNPAQREFFNGKAEKILDQWAWEDTQSTGALSKAADEGQLKSLYYSAQQLSRMKDDEDSRELLRGQMSPVVGRLREMGYRADWKD